MTALAAIGAPVVLEAARETTPRGGLPRARPARVADACTIERLVRSWSHQGFTIARPLGDVLANLGDFAVSTREDDLFGVVACGALETVSAQLGEIRSVAVDPRAAGNGAGRAVVAHLVAEARAREMVQICLLTRVPAFFERCGFQAVGIADLPGVFIAEHLAGQGRTHVGRTAMTKALG